MTTRLLLLACLTLTLGACLPALAQTVVVPGRSVGRVFLGMTRPDMWKILGAPGRHEKLRASGIPVPHAPGGYTLDTWTGGGHELKVLCRSARVVQIEAASPAFATRDGVSTASPFTLIRRAFPRMRVEQYGFAKVHPSDKPSLGSVVYYMDDVERGLAFTNGSQDYEATYGQLPGIDYEAATYDELPTLKPDSLIVHPSGRQALPVSYDGDARVSVMPRRRSDFLAEMRAWFAGGPHSAIHKEQ